MKKLAVMLILLFMFSLTSSAIDTSITLDDDTGDVFYLDALEGPAIILDEVDTRPGYGYIDIESLSYVIDVNAKRITINLDLLDDPIFNDSFAYYTDMTITPYSDDTVSPIQVAQIASMASNRSLEYYILASSTLTNGSNYQEYIEVNHTVTDTVISWTGVFEGFPFDEIFVQNTTYFTSYADAHYYTDPVNYATTPIYMDRMEYIPAWVLAENDDDDDLLDGILGDFEIPVSFSAVTVGLMTAFILRKTKRT